MKSKTLKKVCLIEEPKSVDLFQSELEEALGGWNCGSYKDGWFTETCQEFNNGSCTGGKAENYCVRYSS